MYWFNNNFNNLTRSILFPGGGGASANYPFAHSYAPQSASGPTQNSNPTRGGNNPGYNGNGAYGQMDPMAAARRRASQAEDMEDLRDLSRGRSGLREEVEDRPRTSRPPAAPAATTGTSLTPEAIGRLRDMLHGSPNASGGGAAPAPSPALQLPTLPHFGTGVPSILRRP